MTRIFYFMLIQRFNYFIDCPLYLLVIKTKRYKKANDRNIIYEK